MKNKVIHYLTKLFDDYFKNCNDDLTMFDPISLEIYRENNFILNYTKKLYKKLKKSQLYNYDNINNSYKKEVEISIVCYIIIIKYYFDCKLSYPYSNLLLILDKEDWIKLEKLEKLEKKILDYINFIV